MHTYMYKHEAIKLDTFKKHLKNYMCMYTMYVETNKTRLLHATYNHTYIHTY